MKSNPPVSRAKPALLHRLGIIVAVLVLTLLIGSMVFVLNLAHRQATATVRSSLTSVHTASSQVGVYVGSADGAIYRLNAANGQLTWRYKTRGRSIAAPATVDNSIVYAGSLDGSVYALNATDGKLIWQYQTNGAILSSPRAANGVVYVGSSDGYEYALNAKTGTPIWKYYTGPGTSAVVARTVVVIQNVVYGSSYDDVAHSYLYALDASNGSQLWRIQVANQNFTDPQVVSGVIYIASWAIKQEGGPDIRDSYVYAFNAANGSQIWRSDKVGDFILFAPTVDNGVVYAGSRDAFVYAMDARTGKRLWRYNTGGTIYTSPSVANGVVYVGVMGAVLANTTSNTTDTTQADGYIIAVDAAKGSLIWQHSLPNYAGTTLTVFDSVIYVGSEDNMVYALTIKDGSTIWHYQDKVGVAVKDGNAPITVAP